MVPTSSRTAAHPARRKDTLNVTTGDVYQGEGETTLAISCDIITDILLSGVGCATSRMIAAITQMRKTPFATDVTVAARSRSSVAPMQSAYHADGCVIMMTTAGTAATRRTARTSSAPPKVAERGFSVSLDTALRPNSSAMARGTVLICPTRKIVHLGKSIAFISKEKTTRYFSSCCINPGLREASTAPRIVLSAPTTCAWARTTSVMEQMIVVTTPTKIQKCAVSCLPDQ